MSVTEDGNSLAPWRLLIVRREGNEVLVGRTATKCTLPEVRVPQQRRIAPNINRAVERDLGLRVVSLYEVTSADSASSEGVPYYAVRAMLDAQTPPEGTFWTRTRSLTVGSFGHEADFAAIDALRSSLEAAKNDGAGEPFRRPDWLTQVASWVECSLRPHSSHLTGEFEQFNASSTFSLIRFETTRQPVWFKAVGEPNVREYAITLTLTRRVPAFVPQVLASESRWNSWLAAQAPGNSLASERRIERWETTAANLARLQIASMHDSQEIARAGAHDLRVAALLAMREAFFEFVRVCSQTPLRYPKDLTLPEVSELEDAVNVALDDLAELPAIDTLGHMDLNPGNIFCTAQRTVFLDWAEAFVGSPFLSFEYLLQHFRRAFPNEPALEERFRDAYLNPWRSIVPREELERTLLLSPLIALFAYAATIGAARSDVTQHVAGTKYLLSLVRRMKCEVWRRKLERVSL